MFDISRNSSNFPFFKADIILLLMLVSCVQSISIRYIRTLSISSESSRDCATEQDILHQNCVQGIVFYNCVFFVQTMKHESCSSISILWSLQWRLFAVWQISALKSLLVRRNETQKNSKQCGKLFRSSYRGTSKLQKSQNNSCTQTSAAQILLSSGQWRDIWWTAVHQLLLSCTDCITSNKTSGELRCISCYCHTLAV